MLDRRKRDLSCNKILVWFEGKIILLSFSNRSKAGNCWMVKDIFNSKMNSFRSSFRDHLYANNGISTNSKEVIMDTNLFYFEKSYQIEQSSCSSDDWGATYSSPTSRKDRSGAGRALRSILPLGVRGIYLYTQRKKESYNREGIVPDGF